MKGFSDRPITVWIAIFFLIVIAVIDLCWLQWVLGSARPATQFGPAYFLAYYKEMAVFGVTIAALAGIASRWPMGRLLGIVAFTCTGTELALHVYHRSHFFSAELVAAMRGASVLSFALLSQYLVSRTLVDYYHRQDDEI